MMLGPNTPHTTSTHVNHFLWERDGVRKILDENTNDEWLVLL